MLHNIRTLIKLANDLDRKGLYKEADLVDQTLNKLAASYVHDDDFTGDIEEATRSAREVAATPPRGLEEYLDRDSLLEDLSEEEGEEEPFIEGGGAGVDRFMHDADIDPDTYEHESELSEEDEAEIDRILQSLPRPEGFDDEEGVEEEEYEYDDEEDEGEFDPGTGARFKP
jgi:hypothetical protein